MVLKILHSNRAVLLDGEQVCGRVANGGKRTFLIVSDLHIGFEEKFKSAGISIESNVNSMVAELLELISENNATDLIIDGDVKSSIDRISNSEWENIPKFFSKLPLDCDVTVVSGNHDAGLSHLIPERVELVEANGLMIGRSLVMHGHTKPLPKFSDCDRLIIGHLHPIYQQRGSPLSGQPVWVISKILKKRVFGNVFHPETSDSGHEGSDPLLEVIVIPSFNKDLVVTGFASAAAAQERRNSPILKELKSAEDGLVLTLNGEIIGDSSLLSKIL